MLPKTNLRLEAWIRLVDSNNGKAAGLPDALINAAFSEDVLKKKQFRFDFHGQRYGLGHSCQEVREEKPAPSLTFKKSAFGLSAQ